LHNSWENLLSKRIKVPEFKEPLSVLQLLLPCVCSGLLFGGFLLFLYLGVQYRSRLYAVISLFGFNALLFVASETAIALWGAWLLNRPIGLQFHRLEQLAGCYFLFSFPFLLLYLLQLNKTWKRINFIVSIIGLGLASIITIMAFIEPDLFISMSKETINYMELKIQMDYARGREGLLYYIRDGLLALIIIYGISCIIADLIKHKNKDLIPTAVGVLIAIYSAMVDMIFVHFRVHYDFFSGIGFSRFSFGLTFMVLILMSGITRKLIQFSKEIERANEKIILSEQKYRILADGTRDCIFSLNEDYFFIHANKQALQQLNLRNESLKETNFFDLVHLGDDDKVFLKDFIKDKLRTLKTTKNSVSFKAKLKTFFSVEPKTYDLSFDYLEKEDGDEIIGTAFRIHEDVFLRYIQAESSRFVINNYLVTVEEVSNRLVSYLPKFMNDEGVKQVRMGLREILINAVEHGNLNLTYEEKSKALQEDNYFLFIRNRQDMPQYQNKNIIVEYSLSPTKVVYRVTDHGRGFNVKEVYRKAKGNLRTIPAHGRGIIMAQSVFDKVIYNKSGNQVTLIKEFNK
jgi:PAS domain-containing protein